MAAEYFTFYQSSGTTVADRRGLVRLYNGEPKDVEGNFEVAIFERTALELGSRQVENEVALDFSVGEEFARNRVVNRSEERYWMEIAVDHDVDPFWVGRLKSVRVTGERVRLIFSSRLGTLNLTGPSLDFQYRCRFRLYDIDTCRAPTDNRGIPVQVTVIDNFNGAVTLTGAELATSGELNKYAYGRLVQGERDYRITAVRGDTVVGLNTTNQLILGAATIWQGCDKLMSTCKEKFDNLVNFGGFPYKPPVELWGLPLTEQVNDLNRQNL